MPKGLGDHSVAMPEHIFIKKRQRHRKRRDGFLTTKVIVRLIIVSAVLLALFLNFIGDPTVSICEEGCESKFSFGTWVLGFIMIFGAVIGLAGIVGALIATLKWSRRNSSGALTALMDEGDSNNTEK